MDFSHKPEHDDLPILDAEPVTHGDPPHPIMMVRNPQGNMRLSCCTMDEELEDQFKGPR